MKYLIIRASIMKERSQIIDILNHLLFTSAHFYIFQIVTDIRFEVQKEITK